MMRWKLWVVASVMVSTMAGVVQAADKLELQPGDHICIVGNTLAERMQHFDWLETMIQSRFPGHRLVIRNLGYSGDEIDGFRNPNHRMRSMDFGSHDEWLSGSAPVPQPKKLSPKDEVAPNRFQFTDTQADVVLAFYGYNESWAGEAGLPTFKENVKAFIEHTLAQKYNGKSAPRLVLFSPIAHEFIADPNLPTRAQVDLSNARLKQYAAAMAEVARSKNVPFVDLFEVTLQTFGGRPLPVGGNKAIRIDPPATINGIHQNDKGDWLIATHIDQSLFGPRTSETEVVDPLRAAIHDKNWVWFQRYRATDGYSTFGERAFLKFTEGPGGYGEGRSNYGTVQRELEVLDIMTANRDQRIWAVAKGTNPDLKDDNLPPFFPVISNKPGSLEGGKHAFLSGEEAIGKMTVGTGLKVNLFADEGMFPELVNPVQMAFDAKGRLWVAAWETYPHWKPTEQMDDKLLILEDTNGDGKADACKTFAGDLHNPTGFEFWGGGVIVAQGPDILFLKDTNGDDKYDVKDRIVHGFDTADTHHTANSFVLDPGGALYFQEGTFHHSQIETPWGPPRRVANGAVFRYEPRTQKTDVYVSFRFANPHGHVFDKWGQDIVVDGTGAQPYHGPLFSSHLDYPNKHNLPPQVYQQRTRPCAAIEILSSSHFPEEFRGNLLVANVIGFQGILRYKLEEKDSSLGATELEPILYSTDPNFRPADIEVGPDGAIYFTDWHNPIIGHMQHNLRDPNRDRTHGRVYKVTHEGRPLVKPEPIAGEPTGKLIGLLQHKDDRVRYRARIELSGRTAAEVRQANKLVPPDSIPVDQRLPEPKGEELEHLLLERLWLEQSQNTVNAGLLDRVLQSSDFRARAAAVRVISAWHDRLPNALDLLRRAAADEASRVRLMAVWASSFIHKPEAIEVVLIAQDRPVDPYLEFLSKEVLRTLEPITKASLAKGDRIPFTTEAGARYFLKNLSNEKLLAEERSRPVYLELLYRPGLQDAQRREAIQGLAKLDNKPELAVIMDAIRWMDEKQANADVSVVFDLVRQLTSRSATELSTARAELAKLAIGAKQPVFRQIGLVSLINIDGTVDQTWTLAGKSAKSLEDFVNAMPLISDPNVRATLYDKIEPLLDNLPESLRTGNSQGTLGRFVRIELPGKGTLTLAEVEVMSGGDNLARRGRASQKNTSHGGDAARAIDGNKSGSYGDGGQTHTEENTGNPWWEVDLGEDRPIDQILIHNRTEDALGQRLANFTLKVLDAQRNEVFKQVNQPAPTSSAKFELAGGGPAAQVRRAAMNALTQVRGQEGKTFKRLASFVKESKADVDRVAAVRALQRLPKPTWPADEAPLLIDVLMAKIKEIPAKERTLPAALDQLEFADALTTLLPPDRGKAIRAELGELGVRVIRIGTLFERMAFDKDVIVVRAGKPVEFLLENTDLMPHNFVIAQPGSLEEIGLMSEAMAQQPGFAERQFVPPSKAVLAASKLLQPRDVEKVSFNVPNHPGVYPFVCTYPGHWRRMYGALYVVADLDEYQANPEAYLAAAKIVPQDVLLKDRRPRTEWKFEELAETVAALKADRNFANGKQMFTVANCVGCHKLDNVGNNFGPDLAKLDPKVETLPDLLRSILEPSLRIHEKYQTAVFVLNNGKSITGLLLEEANGVVKVMENPLVSQKPTEIKVADIDERQTAKTSLMPKGLLDKLTKDEILDLVAYVKSGGNAKYRLFHADHEHHH